MKVKINAKALGRKNPITITPSVDKVKQVIQSRIDLQELDEKIKNIDSEDMDKMELTFMHNKLQMLSLTQDLIKDILPINKTEIDKLDKMEELDLVNLRIELTNKILYPNGFDTEDEDSAPSKS